MGQNSKYIEEIWNNTIKIEEGEYDNLNERCHCECLICGHKWEPKFADLKYGRGCSVCSKKKILESNSENRIKKSREIATNYGKIHNIEIVGVYEYGKAIMVKGINHNIDKEGNEIGEFTQNYYNFLHGVKSKKEIGDSLRYSTDEWIEKAKKVHSEYTYENVKYINNRKPVIITCPKHGNFSVMPKTFMKEEYKCAKCKKDEQLIKNGEYYLNKAKEKFPELDFSKAIYNGRHKKITVICKEHGEFQMTYGNLMKSKGCPQCTKDEVSKSRKMTKQDFIERAKKVHNNRYDYSKVEYVKSTEKVCIICPEHGEFWQTPSAHLSGNGCPFCSGHAKKDTQSFIDEARKIHGDKYDYSKVIYHNTHKKVCIICPEHGEFWQTPRHHLMGYGCSKCSNNFLDKDTFICKAREIHGDKYDYSKVEYCGNKKKVCIICPEHGEFWQTPNSHLNGRGCPSCNSSHLEKEMKLFLDRNNVNYIYQYRNKKIFNRQSIDFYLPDYNIGIECQGEEHYNSNFYKTKLKDKAEELFIYRKELDEKKRNICKENNINLVYFLNKKLLKYKDSDNIYFTSPTDLLSYIKGTSQKNSINEEGSIEE